LFRIFLPFLLGIIAALSCINPSYLFYSGFGLSLFGIILIGFSRFKDIDKYRFRWLGGFGISFILLALGILNVGISKLDLRPDFFAKNLKATDKITVQITEPLQVKENSVRALAKVYTIESNGYLKSASGKLILYFQKDSGKIYPSYGDLISLGAEINPLKPPVNPGEFDYCRYMASQNIYHSVFLKTNEWHITAKNKGNRFWEIIYNIRLRLKSEIEQALPGTEEKGIAEALAFGDESDIPNEIMTEYAGTGTLHILSVSGLHVAVILIALNWLFSFLTRIKYGKYIRLVIILILIWAYAFLTGFSPPIARSVIMFSLVYLGIHTGRQTNIYNSICGAAFILLLIDPLLIMQAGFQLSFIALTGIVWLQPRVSVLWNPSNKFIKSTWELAAASIAAQIITLPISILYFNQLSIYFLPANLIVIPASFVVLGAGIAFVFAQLLPIAWIHFIMGKILFVSIYGLNKIVQFINHLPGANWQGLYINWAGAGLLYIVIIFITISLIEKNKKHLIVGLVSALVFLFVRNYDIGTKTRCDEINVLAVSKQHVIVTVKDKNRLFVFSDSSFVFDKQQLKYHVFGYAWQNYIRPHDIIPIDINVVNNKVNYPFSFNKFMISFNDKKILIIGPEMNSRDILSNVNNKFDFDIVVLNGNPDIALNLLYKKYPFKHVIAAYGNDQKKTMAWETQCLENNITFTNLRTDNYFNLPIL